jgi:hypothetical protein
MAFSVNALRTTSVVAVRATPSKPYASIVAQSAHAVDVDSCSIGTAATAQVIDRLENANFS